MTALLDAAAMLAEAQGRAPGLADYGDDSLPERASHARSTRSTAAGMDAAGRSGRRRRSVTGC